MTHVQPALSQTLLEAGAAILKRDNRAEARHVFEMALAEARADDDRRAQVDALLELARLSEDGQDPEAGRQAVFHCLTLCQGLDLPAEAGAALGSLGLISLSQGDLDEAIGHQARSLEMFEAAGSRLGQALALARLGRAYQAKQEFHTARPYLENALSVFEELGERRAAGQVLWNLGCSADLADHDLAQAGACYEQALAHLEQSGSPDEVQALRGNLRLIDRYLQAQDAGRRLVRASSVLVSSQDTATLEVCDPDGNPVEGAFTILIDDATGALDIELSRPGSFRISVRPAADRAGGEADWARQPQDTADFVPVSHIAGD